MAYRVAPDQALCVLALTLKERASELILNLIPEPLKRKKDERRLVPCMGEYLNFQSSSLSLSLSLSPCLSPGLERCTGRVVQLADGVRREPAQHR